MSDKYGYLATATSHELDCQLVCLASRLQKQNARLTKQTVVVSPRARLSLQYVDVAVTGTCLFPKTENKIRDAASKFFNAT